MALPWRRTGADILDNVRREHLHRLRKRRIAERDGWYRAFESGIAKALVRSRRCVRLDDGLADQIADELANETTEASEVAFETSELNCDGWLSCARDLLAATSETLFVVLSQPGAPYRGANCGEGAVIDILEEVLDREESIIVLSPSSRNGFHFDLSSREHTPHGVFAVAAWGAMASILSNQVQSMTCKWHVVPRN